MQNRCQEALKGWGGEAVVSSYRARCREMSAFVSWVDVFPPSLLFTSFSPFSMVLPLVSFFVLSPF